MVGKGESAASRLEQAAQALIGVLESSDNDALLYEAPVEREWSAMETLAHVAELVPFWTHRAQHVAQGTLGDRPYDRNPEELALRNGAWREHGRDTPRQMLDRLRSGFAESAAILRAIPDEAWEHTALYAPEQRHHSVSELVEQRILVHVEMHARQVAAAVAHARQSASQSPG